MHNARLVAWVGCIVTTMYTEVGRGRRKQTLPATLYGRSLRRAVARILKGTWEAVKIVRTAKFHNDDTKDEKGRAVCGKSERITIVALWVPSAEMLYLAVRENFFEEYEKTTWNCSGLLRSVVQSG